VTRLATALCALVVAMAIAAGVVLVATANSKIPPLLTYSQTPPTKQILDEAGMGRLSKHDVQGFVQMTLGEAHEFYPGLVPSVPAAHAREQVYVLTAFLPSRTHDDKSYSVVVDVASARVIHSAAGVFVPFPGDLIGRVRL